VLSTVSLILRGLLEKTGHKSGILTITGGNDVFVDIGDKSWGVRACQRYFNGINPSKTLHIGDQFLSAGANDFKVSLQQLASISSSWTLL